jgi:hypothetical protein
MRLTPERASSVNFMPLKYPLVHEFVIVIADLYLPEEAALDADALPGLDRVARFGRRGATPAGWRAWLAGAMGRGDLAAEPAARVAALCLRDAGRAGFLWLSTPLHLIAGLTSLHLEQRGLLRLPLATLRILAQDFHKVFHGTGFTLEPLPSGGFLLSGPAVSEPRTVEPARCVGMDVGAALPVARSLRTLGAEMEIWLHEHPVNLERLVRAEPAISTLWLWGGGPAQGAPGAPAVPSAHLEEDRIYGRDPYLDGLAFALGVPAAKLPASMEELLQRPARRLVIVVDLAEILARERAGSAAAALAAIDACWILPATRLVARGAVRCLRLLANDRCLALRRHDRLRLWRPARRGLHGLA